MSSSDDEDSTSETTLNTSGLDRIMSLFGADAPVARIGILGGKVARSAGADPKSNEPNNAEIGAIHEFGMDGRSFLRVPIADHLDKVLEGTGALDEDVLKEALDSGDLVPYMEKVAIAAVGIVNEAFNTGGYGKWKPSDMSKKQNEQTLVETGQLRNAITYDVKKVSGGGE